MKPNIKLKLILSQILILSLHFGFTQTIGDVDSKWVYDYNEALRYDDPEGITIIKYRKDTLIGSRETRVFSRTAHREIEGFYHRIYDLDPIYLYPKNGVVEFSLDKVHFDTLLNFNAQIGRSWNIYFNYFFDIPDSLEITVLDTFHREINGRQLFGQEVRYYSNTLFIGEREFRDTIYEMIGNKTNYIIPYYYVVDTPRPPEDGGRLRCFLNDHLGLTQLNDGSRFSSYEYSCDQLLVSSTEITSPPKDVLKVYPNPVDKTLYIASTANKTMEVIFRDFSGRMLKEQKVESGINTIDISTFPPGIYLISAGNQSLHKVIKE